MAATASSVCCGHDDNNDATKLFAGSGVAAPSDLGTRGRNNECPMQGGVRPAWDLHGMLEVGTSGEDC